MSLPTIQRFGRFELRRAQRQLLDGDRELPIGARALDLLVALIDRCDRVVPKHELLDAVWPGLVVEENNLQVQVSGLRKLLGPAAIATVPGRGYRFVIPLQGGGEPTALAGAGPAGGPEPVGSDPPLAPTVPTAPPALHASAALPAEGGALLGRDDDLGRLLAAVVGHRLCTVLGTVGVGKTRLALAAAHRCPVPSVDAIAWVELGRLAPEGGGASGASTAGAAGAEAGQGEASADSEAVARAVAAALELPLPGAHSAAEGLLQALAPQTALLVLDNAEHVVAAVAHLVAQLLARAPGVHLIVTSQRPLRLPAEHLLALGTLAVPEVDEPLDGALARGALALLVQRAQALNPRFAVDGQSLPLAIDLCRTLDGLPLALELAAARVSWMGLAAVHGRLTERFRLLVPGPGRVTKTGPQPQRALQAAMDWSHSLLSAEQQQLLHALGVFRDGFTLDLAEGLAGRALGQDPWVLMDTLGALVDASWVQTDAGPGARFRLLESARLYAIGHLVQAGRWPALRQMHAEVMAQMAARNFEVYLHQRTDHYVSLFHPEADNLLSALDLALDEADARLAAPLFACCAMVCYQTARMPELLLRDGRMVALWSGFAADQHALVLWSRLMVHQQAAPARAQELASQLLSLLDAGGQEPGFAHLARTQVVQLLAVTGSLDAAQALLDRLRADARDAEPVHRLNVAQVTSMLRLLQGRYEEALATAQSALAISEALGAANSAGMNRANAVACLLGMGRYEEAVERTAELLPSLVGMRWTAARAVAQCNLLSALVLLGRYDQAWTVAGQALSAARRSGYRPALLAEVAELAAADDRAALAAALIGHIQALEALGLSHPQPAQKQQRSALLGRLQTQLGAAALARALAHGETLVEAEVDAMLSGSRPLG